MDDDTFTEILGPKCPECGWRSEDGSNHRPAAGELMVACPRWVEGGSK